jgi:hydrogenase expression/formation protein HypC
MCLALPGRIESIEELDPLSRHGLVRFGGVARDVNLAFVPEAVVGDYVIVHVGVAISRLDQEAAALALSELEALAAVSHQG